LIVGLSGIAHYALPVPPAFAQQPPQPPAASVNPDEPLRSPATITCPNGNRYQLTTESREGQCKIYRDLGTVIGGLCTDGANSALQSCAEGCKETRGSGACRKLDPSAPEQ
jgi:hypothetical protein